MKLLHLRVNSADAATLQAFACALGDDFTPSDVLRRLAGLDESDEHLIESWRAKLSPPHNHAKRTEFVYMPFHPLEWTKLVAARDQDAEQTRQPKPLSHFARLLVGLGPTSAWAQAAGYATSKRCKRPVLRADDIDLYWAEVAHSTRTKT